MNHLDCLEHDYLDLFPTSWFEYLWRTWFQMYRDHLNLLYYIHKFLLTKPQFHNTLRIRECIFYYRIVIQTDCTVNQLCIWAWKATSNACPFILEFVHVEVKFLIHTSLNERFIKLLLLGQLQEVRLLVSVIIGSINTN